ncbi:MAG TPA: RsmE family RNA methyltransferase [Isosphaeraceae bacterium]|nr:RsmE family RNA methyltransferase [Isosphaeraceae bacterium]
MAERFYCPELSKDGRLALEGGEARHLARVRRLGPGDVVEVFDGRGFATRAEVVEAGRDRVELRTLGDPLADRAAACRLTLATAVPKGERFDWLIEKATELGVERLVPLVTERSVVDPRIAKLDRLRRVVVEAAKQCGRNRLMELDRPTPWPAFLAAQGETARWMAHPGGRSPSAWPRPRLGGRATLAIGPEGGFTEAEAEAAGAAGWRTIRLGATRLRIETAGLAGCSMLLALCEGPDE